MTRFRGAKVCSVWLQERIEDHNIQPDNKYKSGLKVKIQYWYVMLAWWLCTITRPTPMTIWLPWLSSTQSTSTRTLECALYRSSWVSASWYIAHAPHGSSPSCVRHFIPSTCAHDVCGSPSTLISPFSSPFYLTHLLSRSFQLLHPLEVRRQPAHSAQRENGFHWRDLLEHRLWAQRPTTSRRLLSSPTQSSWPRHRSSPTKGFPRTPSTMTPHSRVCCVKLTDYMAITLNENTCLSVSRRRQCPTEWSDLLETDRGDPVSQRVRMYRLGPCSTNEKSEFLPSARQKWTDPNDRRSLRKLGEIVESQHQELHCARAEEGQRRDQQLLHGQSLQQNLEWREAHQRSLSEMEEMKKFQSSTFETIARRRLVEDQDTLLWNLLARYRNSKHEINCMSDSKEFQDAESIRSGNSHVTSRPVSFPPLPFLEGMLCCAFGMPSRREGPPSIWDTHGISGNVIVNPDATSSTLFPQELNQWSSSVEEPLYSLSAEKSERRKQIRDLRCQSGPSAKDSVIFSGGDSLKNCSADPQRFQISDLHPLWQVPFTSNFCLLEDKIQDWGMYLFTISYGSYALDQRSGDRWSSGWIKIFVIYSWYFNAEFWSPRCEDCFSTEQKSSIILTSKEESVWRNKKPRSRTVSFSEDRLLAWSTNISRSLEATILSKTSPTYSLLFFEMTKFRNSILSVTEFNCPWRKSRMMTSWKDCTN